MGGFTNAECKSFGINPHDPRKDKWPAYGQWRRTPGNDTPTAESWTNGRYDVCVCNHIIEHPELGNVQCIRIQICNWDQSAKHDWRDFQRIKTHFAGQDWEGVELYPAEGRLLDPSNAFYLWCYPPGVISWVGIQKGRSVKSPTQSEVPQRAFETK